MAISGVSQPATPVIQQPTNTQQAQPTKDNATENDRSRAGAVEQTESSPKPSSTSTIGSIIDTHA